MCKLIMSLLLFCVAITAHGTPMPEQDKKEFIEANIKSCMIKQHLDPKSEEVPYEELYKYCYCTATRASYLITIEDIQVAYQTKNYESLIPMMESAGNYCIQKLLHSNAK